MSKQDEIVYLETRKERWRGRWRAMSRTARIGVVSIIFGAIGLLTCWLVSYVPFLSVPFSLIGFVLGLGASLTSMYLDRRRDAFWFPLIGLVLSLLGLMIGVGNWFYHDRQAGIEAAEQVRAQDEAQRSRLVGRWRQQGSPNGMTAEFTPAGSIVVGKKTSGDESGDEIEETIGKYSLRGTSVAIGFAKTGSNSDVTSYSFDFVSDKELLLQRGGRLSSRFDLSGRWQRVGPPPAPTEIEREIAGYRQQLEKFQSQRTQIVGLLDTFETQRTDLLTKLRAYDDGRAKDAQWKVFASELNTLVNQIEVIRKREPMLQDAIVSLQAAISNRTRKAELVAVGMTDEHLHEILLTRDRLNEELQSAKVQELLQDLTLDDVVEQEMHRAGSKEPDR